MATAAAAAMHCSVLAAAVVVAVKSTLSTPIVAGRRREGKERARRRIAFLSLSPSLFRSQSHGAAGAGGPKEASRDWADDGGLLNLVLSKISPTSKAMNVKKRHNQTSILWGTKNHHLQQIL